MQRVGDVKQELRDEGNPTRHRAAERRNPSIECGAGARDRVGDHLESENRLVDQPSERRPRDRPADRDQVAHDAQERRDESIWIELDHHRTISITDLDAARSPSARLLRTMTTDLQYPAERLVESPP